jgi:hypothetical protein
MNRLGTLLFAALLGGCTLPVSEAVIDPGLREPNRGEFIVYRESEKNLTRPYKEIAIYTYESGAPDAGKQIQLIIQKARHRGADGLILQGVNENWSTASTIVYTVK